MKPRFFYGWVIAGVTAVTLGVGYSVWHSFGVFFLAVVEDFGWGRDEAALAFSVFAIVHGISGPYAGALVERFGQRRVMPIGAILLGGCLVASSMVQTRWQFYLTFGVLASVALNCIGVVPCYTVLNRWFVKHRGLALGISSAGVGLLGIFILVPFNQYMISTVGWRNAYLVLAVIVVAIIAPITFFLQRERPEVMGLLPDGATPHSPPQARSGSSAPPKQPAVGEWTTRSAARTWRFWALFFAYAFAPLAYNTVFVHQAAYFVDLGHDKFLAASLIGLIGLISIPCKIGWGVASDRLGRELSYTLGSVFLILAMVLLIMMPGVSGRWILYAYVVSFALGYGVFASVIPAIAGDLFSGRDFGVIYGILSGGNNLGGAVGPYFAGYVFETAGSYTPAFTASIFGVVASCTLIWLVAPRRFHRGMQARIAAEAGGRIS